MKPLFYIMLTLVIIVLVALSISSCVTAQPKDHYDGFFPNSRNR